MVEEEPTNFFSSGRGGGSYGLGSFGSSNVDEFVEDEPDEELYGEIGLTECELDDLNEE